MLAYPKLINVKSPSEFQAVISTAPAGVSQDYWLDPENRLSNKNI